MKNAPNRDATKSTTATRASRLVDAVLVASFVCIVLPAPEWVFVALIFAQAGAIVHLAHHWWREARAHLPHNALPVHVADGKDPVRHADYRGDVRGEADRSN